MKKLLMIIILACALPGFAQMKSASLTASGLTCSMCSKAIYKALQQVSFVKDVQVDLEHSKFNITFKEGEKVVPAALKKAVQDAGFSVASLQVTATFANASISNDATVPMDGVQLRFINVQQQILNGDKTFSIVDKNYLSAAKYKKYDKAVKAAAAAGDAYHVTL